jgi:hypothetical protein
MAYDLMNLRGQWVIGEMSYAWPLNLKGRKDLFRRVGRVMERVDSIDNPVLHLQAMMERVGQPAGVAHAG